VAFPVPSSVHIPLKGLEEPLFWIHLIDKADMTYPSKSLVVNGEHICSTNGHQPYRLLFLCPRLSRSVHALEDRATLLENVNHCVATPRLTRDSSCVADDGINTRATIVYWPFTSAN